MTHKTVFPRHVYHFFLFICWFSLFSKLSKLRIEKGCIFFVLICCQGILTVFLRNWYTPFLRWSVDFPNFPNFPSSGSDRGVFFSCWLLVKAFWQCFCEMGIPVFTVDLLIFWIFQTFQAQDRIGASFFHVDFLSTHFNSVYERWVYPFFLAIIFLFSPCIAFNPEKR